MLSHWNENEMPQNGKHIRERRHVYVRAYVNIDNVSLGPFVAFKCPYLSPDKRFLLQLMDESPLTKEIGK
jgi:Iap family predicted aminopeptidase